MRKHYFLTDLDGTLLKGDTSMSEFTIKVLNHAINEGVVISYSTARCYESASSVTAGITWKYPLVLYNGALIMNPISKKVITANFLEANIANLIVAEGKKFGLVPLLFCLDMTDSERVLHEGLKKEGYIQFVKGNGNDSRYKEVETLRCPDDYRTLIVTYIGEKDELELAKRSFETLFKDKVHIHFMKDNYIENHYFLELTNINANKEEGLIQWSKLVGCEPKDVTVFGDNLNDIGMFAKAGRKIAVLNATISLKNEADEVIMRNDDDGVANYISGIIGGNIQTVANENKSSG